MTLLTPWLRPDRPSLASNRLLHAGAPSPYIGPEINLHFLEHLHDFICRFKCVPVFPLRCFYYVGNCSPYNCCRVFDARSHGAGHSPRKHNSSGILEAKPRSVKQNMPIRQRIRHSALEIYQHACNTYQGGLHECRKKTNLPALATVLFSPRCCPYIVGCSQDSLPAIAQSYLPIHASASWTDEPAGYAPSPSPRGDSTTVRPSRAAW